MFAVAELKENAIEFLAANEATTAKYALFLGGDRADRVLQYCRDNQVCLLTKIFRHEDVEQRRPK